MPGRVRLRFAGVKELLNSEEVGKYLDSLAGQARDLAQASAPVDQGTFASSFEVAPGRTDRRVSHVITTDPKGLVKESRFRTMTSALDAIR